MIAVLMPILKLIIQAILPILMEKAGDTSEDGQMDTALVARLRRSINK